MSATGGNYRTYSVQRRVYGFTVLYHRAFTVYVGVPKPTSAVLVIPNLQHDTVTHNSTITKTEGKLTDHGITRSHHQSCHM